MPKPKNTTSNIEDKIDIQQYCKNEAMLYKKEIEEHLRNELARDKKELRGYKIKFWATLTGICGTGVLLWFISVLPSWVLESIAMVDKMLK